MFNQLSPRPTMSEFLSSCLSMRNSRLLLLLSTLFCLCQGAFAKEDNREAYAVLDAEGLLKFYYDTNKPSSGTVYDIPWNSGEQDDWNVPEWANFDDGDGYGKLIGNTAIKSVAFDASFSDYRLESAFTMFATCTALTDIDFTNFNTSNVKTMSGMFYSCRSLTALDLSSFITDQVTDMSLMFFDCSALTSLNISSFNTASVTNMSGMFGDCSSLQQLNLSNFNTASVTDMSDMFGDCSRLEQLDLSNFNTASVTDMSTMFDGCSKLQQLDLSNFNTANVTKMLGMFYECSSLEQLDLSNFNTASVTTMRYMFTDCSNLQQLNLTSFNTANVDDMLYMFGGCSSLQQLDVSNFNTANVIDTKHMFSDCESLRYIFCNDDWSSILRSIIFRSEYMFSRSRNLPQYDQNNANDITYATPSTGYFTYALKDNADNTTLIENTTDMPRVGLVGRTLYKDGDWNTLCLPFGLTAEQLAASPLAGFSELRTLSESMFDETTGTLTLNFTPAEGEGTVTAIEAGKPYIIKWANTSETIEDPIFTDVTISNATTPVETNYVDFVGTFSPIDIFTEDKTNLYLGADNLLYYPLGEDMTSFTINSFRAYFQLTLPSGQHAKAFQLNFGDEETGIQEITTPSNLSNLSNPSNLFLTLDGRRLSTRPVTPGIYINRGRKVVIK